MKLPLFPVPSCLGMLLAAFLLWGHAAGATGPVAIRGLPPEPVEIGSEPQFVFDLYVIDNHWGLQRRRETFRQVFHQPVKSEHNPLPGFEDEPSWSSVRRDPDTGKFQLWYQANILQTPQQREAERERRWTRENQARAKKGLEPLPRDHRRFNPSLFLTALAYAESKDGVQWEKPAFTHQPQLTTPNNIILRRGMEAQLLENIPKEAMRGYQYLMVYRHGSLYLIGSHDGVVWDEENAVKIAPKLSSDHPNSIVYDPVLKEYVLFCRPKHLYNLNNDPAPARRIARLASKTLWTDWTAERQPQTIIVNIDREDEGFNFIMAMPVRYHAGIYWGLMQTFRYNDYIRTELAYSRDGVRFERLDEQPKFLELGKEGEWDSFMLMGILPWVEVGDEWWFYYTGGNGPHGADGGEARRLQLGLSKVRKEGLVSMRAPKGGGVMVTRSLVWPGGDLMLNLDARGGECRVAVSGPLREPIDGFGAQECVVFNGDEVEHRVKWKNRSLNELKGEVIRLEFHLKNADFFTFRAEGEGGS